MTPPPLPDSGGSQAQSGTGMCVHHPDLRASFLCGLCGRPICSLCAFNRRDGSRVCAECAGTQAATQPSSLQLATEGYAAPSQIHALKCLQHPEVGAVFVCKACGAPMCRTCDFLVPIDLHLCPKCVASPPNRMSGKRRTLIAVSYALAIWNTFALVVIASGALAGLLKRPDGRMELLAIVLFLYMYPTILGAGLGISCHDRHLRNPAIVWGTVIWNSLLLVLLVVHTLLANLTR